MNTILQITEPKRGKVRCEDLMASIPPWPHNARDQVLECLRSGSIVVGAGVDDHGHKDDGVRARFDDLVDEVAETLGCGVRVVAFGGDGGVGVHVVGAGVEEDDVGVFLEGWADVVGYVLDGFP